MLTVPSKVKDLLHLDTCKKNIRIHFPNGERADICNNLIVLNTVSFKESICSQETLKFGLCEAPVFECEVVGVGNIKGATIEVSCEVYCETPISGAVYKWDLQARVYPIPYGTFVVDSCKRQADMNHRRIVAYGGTANWQGMMHPLEVKKLSPFAIMPTSINYDANAFLVSYINTNPKNYSSDMFNETDYTSMISGPYNVSANSNIWSRQGEVGVWYIRLAIVRTSVQDDNKDLYGRDNLVYLGADYDKAGVIEKIYQIMALCAKYDMPNEYNTREYFEKILTSIEIHWGIPQQPDGTVSVSKNFNIELPALFYPYLTNRKGRFSYTIGLEWAAIMHGNTEVERITFNNSRDATNLTLTKLELKETLLNIDTVLYLNIPGPNTTRVFEPPEEYDGLAELNALVDLTGQFGYTDRNGVLMLLNIKRQFGLLPDTTTYPGLTLYPSGVLGGSIKCEDYQRCWYDDKYEKPFGAVTCTYKRSDNNDYVFILYLTGYNDNSDPDSYKTYDLSNNLIIRSTTWTEAQIQTICETIADNISDVTYMAVDFVGRGLPYVEAGDTFEILTRSNDSITTIVLNKTTSGEQTLTDSYKSVQGGETWH